MTISVGRLSKPVKDRNLTVGDKMMCPPRSRTRAQDPLAHKRAVVLSIAVLLLVALFEFPGCGGGSNSPPPSSLNPVPVLTSLSPTGVAAGEPPFILTVKGSGFISGSVVQWNGSFRTTTFVNSTQLTATIMAVDTATGGTARITVFNPAPGGGTSSPLTFNVNNPTPTLFSISPTSAVAGGPAATLTATGSNFVSASVVKWNSSSLATTFYSSTVLAAAIPAGEITSVGTAQVSVANPTPGGGDSNALTFTIEPPLPLAILTSRLPDSAGGKDYYFIALATGGVPPLSWSLAPGSSLPLALSLDTTTSESAGLISGILGAAGTDTTYNFTLQVTDSAASPHAVTRDVSLTVHGVSLGRNDVCTAGTTAGSTPISNGRLRASLSPYGDIDVYSFHGTAGSQVTIETFAGRLFLPELGWQGSFLDSVLELLDSNCNQLTVNDDIELGYTLDSLIQNFSLPYTGTYFIRVRDWRGDGRPDLIYDLALTGAD